MKIVHILDYLPHYHQKGGGAERAAYNIIKLLERKGHRNIALTLPFDQTPAGDKKIDCRFLKPQEKIIGWKFSFLKRIFNFDIFIFLQVLKIFKREKPDKIHIYNIPIISFAPILAAHLLKIPIYYFIYDYWPFCAAKLLLDKEENFCQKFNSQKCLTCIKLKNFSEKLNLRWRKKIHDFFLNKIAKFITLSKASAEIINKYGFDWDKIGITPLIVDDFRDNIKDKEYNSILYVGWIQRRKGLHVILKALAKVIKVNKDVVLYIASLNEVPEYRKKIDLIIEQENLKEYIKWYKKIPREEFLPIFFKAGIVVIPEQWPNMSPVILLESMSAAKAIIASKIGGLPEFIQDNEDGYLVFPSSEDEFAERILDFLNNPSKIDIFGKKIRERFEKNYCEDIIYKKLLQCYEK